MNLKRSLLAQTALCAPFLLAFGVGKGLSADLGHVLYEPVPIATVRLPAVSSVNGTLDFAAGGSTPGYDIPLFSHDFHAAFRAQGSLSVPLSQSFGLQMDGVVASVQSQFFAHTAGHLFWRDPSVGLAGAYGAYSTWNSIDRWRIAFEGEAYLGRFSFETVTGAEFGDVPSSLFTTTDLAFYPHDDFRLSVGFRHNGAGNSLAGGLEYQFASGPQGGWAAFVDGEVGDRDYQKVLGGIRLYMGAEKSLIRRHREDDPQIKADERSLTGCTSMPGLIASDGATFVDSTVAVAPCNTDYLLVNPI